MGAGRQNIGKKCFGLDRLMTASPPPFNRGNLLSDFVFCWNRCAQIKTAQVTKPSFSGKEAIQFKIQMQISNIDLCE